MLALSDRCSRTWSLDCARNRVLRVVRTRGRRAPDNAHAKWLIGTDSCCSSPNAFKIYGAAERGAHGGGDWDEHFCISSQLQGSDGQFSAAVSEICSASQGPHADSA